MPTRAQSRASARVGVAPCNRTICPLATGHHTPTACRGLKGRLVFGWGGPLLLDRRQTVKARVTIDGSNLYYRALKGTHHKWLDLAALADAVMPSDAEIDAINDYVAHVSGRVDPTAPARQHAYLRAVESLGRVTTVFGKFNVTEKWAGLVQPPEFRPRLTEPLSTEVSVARIYNTEEKGSDVNLGAHLVRDAALGRFDVAGVLTNDTDLCEPIRIVTEEFGLKVLLLMPSPKPARSLAAVASGVRHIGPYLGPCNLPDPVVRADGRTISKPAHW